MNKKNAAKEFGKIILVWCISFVITIAVAWIIHKNSLFTGLFYQISGLKSYVKLNIKEYILISTIITISICVLMYFKYIKVHFEKMSDKRKSLIVMVLIWLVGVLLIYGRFISGKYIFIFKDAGLDTATQYYPIYVNIVNSIQSKTLSVWNFNWGLGCDMLNGQEWFFDPFAILVIASGLIFGTQVIRYMVLLVQMLKILVAIILCYKFLAYYKYSWKAKCLASCMYGFCGYIMLWGQHYFFGAALTYLMLLLWQVERFIHEKNVHNGIAVALSAAFLMVYSVYIGYMILLFGVVYVFVRILWLNDGKAIAEALKQIYPIIITVFIGLLISGIVFIPTAEVLVSVSDRVSGNGTIFDKMYKAIITKYDLKYYISMFARLISNNLMGIRGIFQDYYELPQLSFSLMNIVVIPQVILKKVTCNESKNRKRISILVIALMLVALGMPFISYLFSAFGTITQRWTFVIMPVLAICYAYFFDEILSKKSCNVFLLISSVVLVYVISRWAYMNFKIEYCSVNSVVVIFNVLFAALVILWQFWKKEYFIQGAIMLIIASTFYDGYVSNNYRENYTKELMNDDKIAVTKELLNGLSNDYFYRVEKTYGDFSVASDSFIEMYNPLSVYCSTMSPDLKRFYKNIYNQGEDNQFNHFVLDKEMKLPVLSLTNVKYLLSDNEINIDGLSLLKQQDDIYLYDVEASNSIGILYGNIISQSRFEGLNPSLRNSYLSSNMIVEDQVCEGLEVKDEIMDGEPFDNKKSNFKMLTPTYLKGDVAVHDQRQWLLISIPFRKGWNVYVDGAKAEIIKADYAFIGLKIPPGEHTVEVKYENPIYLYGSLVSIFGILMLIIYVVVFAKYEKTKNGNSNTCKKNQVMR